MKINTKILKYFVLFLFVIEPKTFYLSKGLSFLYAIVNLSVFFGYIIKERLSVKFPLPIVLWIILRIYLIVIMIINNNLTDIDKWGYLTLMVLNIYFIIFNSIKKHETKEMIKGGIYLLIIYLLLNFITLIAFSHGIIPDNSLVHNCDNDYYFLGIKVTYTSYILAALSFLITDYSINNNKKIALILIPLIVANLITSKVSTGIISCIIILVMIVAHKIKPYKLSIKLSVFLSLALNFFVIFMNIQNKFSYIIQNILHKDLSLSNRIYIWNKAINILKNESIFKKIFGNGIFNDGSFINIFDTYLPAHNTWIQYVYEYGLLGTILFIIMLITFNSKKSNSKNYNNLIIIILAILITTISSGIFSYSHSYIPFILLYYYNEIIENNTKKMEMK